MNIKQYRENFNRNDINRPSSTTKSENITQ